MTKINIYKNNKVSKTIQSVVIAILIGIFATFVISLIAGYKYKFVVSPSMEPTYKTKGCIIAVHSCDYEKDVKIGDVVTWGAGKTTFTHRVVGQVTEVNVDENYYVWTDADNVEHIKTGMTSKVGRWVARGDNKSISENNVDAVNPDIFVGKVVFHSNFIGGIVNYIQTNLFLVVFCVVVIFICCMIFI